MDDQNNELRDLFALAAMLGLLTHSNGNGAPHKPDVVARAAYSYADALIKERNHGQ